MVIFPGSNNPGKSPCFGGINLPFPVMGGKNGIVLPTFISNPIDHIPRKISHGK